MRRVFKDHYLEVFRLSDNEDHYLVKANGQKIITFTHDSEKTIPDIMPLKIKEYFEHFDNNPDSDSVVKLSIDCSIPLSDLINMDDLIKGLKTN